MELIIDIPEEVYNGIISRGNFVSDFDLCGAFENGTPLPKGHGRLADLDAALQCIQELENCEDKTFAIALFDWAMSKRVVIEADKEIKNDT